MKNIINLIIILALAFSIALFLGCNGGDTGSSSSSSSSSSIDDDEDGGSSPSSAAPGMAGGSAGMPGGPAGMPGGTAGMPGGAGAPGMAGGPAGMAGGAGMPGMAGGMSGMGGMGTGMDSGSSAASQPQQPKITFDQAPKVSNVQSFTKGNGLTFLVFKFTDEKGIVYKCKLPKAQSEGTWTKREWLSTFKAYRYNTVAENNELARKMNKEKLGSWSWAISMGADTSKIKGYPKEELQQQLVNTNNSLFNNNPNNPYGPNGNPYMPNMNPNMPNMNPNNPFGPNMGPNANPFGPSSMGPTSSFGPSSGFPSGGSMGMPGMSNPGMGGMGMPGMSNPGMGGMGMPGMSNPGMGGMGALGMGMY